MEDSPSHGVTMIVVTHEMMFAREAADRVVFMDDGVIVEEGPPEEVIGNPRSNRLRAFPRRFHTDEATGDGNSARGGRSVLGGAGAQLLSKGAAFSGLDVPIVLILCQGRGPGHRLPLWSDRRGSGRAPAHQPVSDEAVINWAGGQRGLLRPAWVLTGPPDVSIGPCGVFHGSRVPARCNRTVSSRWGRRSPATRSVSQHSVLSRLAIR